MRLIEISTFTYLTFSLMSTVRRTSVGQKTTRVARPGPLLERYLFLFALKISLIEIRTSQYVPVQGSMQRRLANTGDIAPGAIPKADAKCAFTPP